MPVFLLMPSEVWCIANGYSMKSVNGGRETVTADYRKAISSSTEMSQALSVIGSKMTQTGLSFVNGALLIKTMEPDAEASGKSLYQQLIEEAGATYVVELSWETVKSPANRIGLTLQLRAVNVETKELVASVSDANASITFPASSLSAELRNRISARYADFESQLIEHFVKLRSASARD